MEENYEFNRNSISNKNKSNKNRGNRKNNKHKKKMKGINKVFIALAIIIVLIGGVVGAGYWYVMDKLEKTNHVEVEEKDIEITEGVKEQLKGYRNIALLGIDSRNQESYVSGSRSDCIIIASIDENNKEVKLVSVYRDTYVKIPGHSSLDKITHAYSYGGPALTMSTLNTNLDLNITEFVTVNFDAVSEIVDLLGGIQINVTSEEIKYINQYIDETSRVTGKSNKHITTPGKQTLNGVQAVSYARIRYTAGGDYKRTERMRTVIMACLDKAKTKGIFELNNIADEILKKIYTNIDSGEMLSLIPQLASYKIVDSIGWPYEVRGITLDRWYGVPITLESCVSKLHHELFKEENYIPSQTVKDISKSIINKTGYSK